MSLGIDGKQAPLSAELLGCWGDLFCCFYDLEATPNSAQGLTPASELRDYTPCSPGGTYRMLRIEPRPASCRQTPSRCAVVLALTLEQLCQMSPMSDPKLFFLLLKNQV